MLPHPRGAVGPLLHICESVMVTPTELARHWRMSPDYLSNLRRAGKGIPHVKLPTGKVLYRLSDVLAAEISNTQGPITLDRIALALQAYKPLAPPEQDKLLEHLREFLARG